MQSNTVILNRIMSVKWQGLKPSNCVQMVSLNNFFKNKVTNKSHIIYIYIYIYCHPQTDCSVVSYIYIYIYSIIYIYIY